MNEPLFSSVDDLLADARSRLQRLEPHAAERALAVGALLVDIRPQWQRELEGEVPGAWVIERNHLEWRLHPASSARLDAAVPGQRWIVLCSEGYTSSLAADVLNAIGVAATDVVGGFHAWRRAGLATRAAGTATPHDSQVGRASVDLVDARGGDVEHEAANFVPMGHPRTAPHGLH